MNGNQLPQKVLLYSFPFKASVYNNTGLQYETHNLLTILFALV